MQPLRPERLAEWLARCAPWPQPCGRGWCSPSRSAWPGLNGTLRQAGTRTTGVAPRWHGFLFRGGARGTRLSRLPLAVLILQTAPFAGLPKELDHD
jgi:hypothetical protein